MTISSALHQYLNRAGVPYEVTLHERTNCALQTARTASISADMLAKGVLLRRANGYLLAIVPASRQVRLEDVGSCLHEPVCLATESEVSDLFDDCEPGSIPPIGEAYGVQTIVDERLEGLHDIYFEAGDHYSLVHLKGQDFDELTADVLHAQISTRH
jgi:Ala-tRNA(Pro) deacylase